MTSLAYKDKFGAFEHSGRFSTILLVIDSLRVDVVVSCMLELLV